MQPAPNHQHTCTRLHILVLITLLTSHFCLILVVCVGKAENIRQKTQTRKQLAAVSLHGDSPCLPPLPRPLPTATPRGVKQQLLFAGIMATATECYKSRTALRIPFSTTSHLVQCTSRDFQQTNCKFRPSITIVIVLCPCPGKK